MTFIASVKAKNGVAIIADSLVTTSTRVIERETFYSYLDKKTKESKDEKISLTPTEIEGLFTRFTSHTKNYEEKLFKYDSYTALTTAGSAVINDKKIQKIIGDICTKLKTSKKQFALKSIEKKIDEFKTELVIEIKKHIEKYEFITPTTFIFTNYNSKLEKTNIYKVILNPADKKAITKEDYDYFSISISSDYQIVVCDGQNNISERILYGNFFTLANVLPTLLACIFDEIGLDKSTIPADIVDRTIKSKDDKLKEILFGGMKIMDLNPLSLQEAVELANLLMRIEMDFQSYTERIPTVGGVIKIAIIDKDGFEFIAGDKITKPQHI